MSDRNRRRRAVERETRKSRERSSWGEDIDLWVGILFLAAALAANVYLAIGGDHVG